MKVVCGRADVHIYEKKRMSIEEAKFYGSTNNITFSMFLSGSVCACLAHGIVKTLCAFRVNGPHTTI
jgi:hypothetical protein